MIKLLFLLVIVSISNAPVVQGKDYCDSGYYRQRKLAEYEADKDRGHTKREPIHDGNIRPAVQLWLEDPVEAQSRYGHISDWDTSGVTWMRELFKDARTFNEDISGWDTSCVTTMHSMFYGAFSFNQPISYWNVERVDDMYSMFRDAVSFNQDLYWNTYSLEDMSFMFSRALSMQGDLSSFHLSNAYTMQGAFSFANYNSDSITQWDVSNVVKMTEMFKQNPVFDQNLNHWRPKSLVQYSEMFYNATSFGPTKLCWKDLPSDPPLMSFQVFCFTDKAHFDPDCVDHTIVRNAERRCEDPIEAYTSSWTDFFAEVGQTFTDIGQFFVNIWNFVSGIFGRIFGGIGGGGGGDDSNGNSTAAAMSAEVF